VGGLASKRSMAGVALLGLAVAVVCGTGVAAAHALVRGAAGSTSRCERRQLHLATPQTNGAAGTVHLIFTFKNRSGSTCRLFGYPGMRLLNRHRRRMPTTVIRVPAPEQSVLVAPGGRASFSASYSDVPTGSQKCPNATYAAVWPPNDFRTLTVAFPFPAQACGGRIHVWPVVPGKSHF
jgi:hypothetical protein